MGSITTDMARNPGLAHERAKISSLVWVGRSRLLIRTRTTQKFGLRLRAREPALSPPAIADRGDYFHLGAQYKVNLDKRLFFPAILFLCNIASAIACFAGGDWKRGLYWTASSICIASVSA